MNSGDSLAEASTRVASDVPHLPRESEPVLPRGSVVGRYLILEQVGSGAMGIVYSAYDPELHRKIAIKVLRVRFWGSGGRERALAEAQSLAQLSHANVVTVYDVGTLGDQLFLAMELIEGQPLSRWLAAAPRTWREVLTVLLQAGRGLEAAHAAGVIHRDVKPANILVRDSGEACIVDFGVAIASDSHDGEAAGTPAYMAPEQLQGTATAKTDLYGFCTTAWEALYGRRPAQDEASRVPSMSLTPSRADSGSSQRDEASKAHAVDAPPRRLRRALRVGLSSDPAERGESMTALLATLAPVLHRRVGPVAGLALVAAVASTIAIGALVKAPAPVVDPCQTAGDTIDVTWTPDVGDRIGRAFSATDLAYAGQTARRVTSLLAARASEWAETKREVCRATWQRGEQSEALLDLRMRCLDRRHGEFASLVQLFTDDVDASLIHDSITATSSLPPVSDCLELEGDAAYPEPVDPGAIERLTELRRQIDTIKALTLAGRVDEAVHAGQQVIEQTAALAFPPAHADALVALGSAQAAGRDRKAGATFEQGIIAAAAARDDRLAGLAAAKLVWVVGYLQDRPKEGSALVPLAEAAVIRAGNPPRLRAEYLTAVGSLHLGAGDYDNALDYMQRSFALYERAWGTDDARLGRALHNLGLVAVYAGRTEAAITYLERARDVWVRSLGPDHPRLGHALNSLGMAQSDAKRFEDAEANYRRALAIWEQAYGSEHPALAMAMVNLGVELRRQDKLGESQHLLERALRIREEDQGPEHQKTGVALSGLAATLAQRGLFAKALLQSRRALTIFETKLPDDHEHVIAALLQIGTSLIVMHRSDEARVVLERAQAGAQGKKPTVRVEIDLRLADALWTTPARRSRARQLVERALELSSQDDGMVELYAQAERWLAKHPL